MKLETPIGSKISVTREGPYTLIVVPQNDGGVVRYAGGLFLLAWLGGWFIGLKSAIESLASGTSNNSQAFLVFWLIAWSIGGVGAMYAAYWSFRRPVPEALILKPDGVTYDSGSPTLQGNSDSTSLKQAFPKRNQVELDRRKLQSLRLRETENGNRLTIDADALRLDIARSASEIEREWLYKVLVDRYSLPVSH